MNQYTVQSAQYRVIKTLILIFVFLGTMHHVLSTVFAVSESDCLNKSVSELSPDDMNVCINEILPRIAAAYAPAQEKNKANLAGLKKQIDNLNKRISSISQELKNKEKDIQNREKDITFAQKILNEKAVNQYMDIRLYDPVLSLISADDAVSAFRIIKIREQVAEENRKTIEKYLNDIINLKKDKESLEKNKLSLAALQKKVSEDAKFLEGEVGKVESFLSVLSAKQQEIVDAKQSALAGATGISFDTQTSSSACPVKPISYNSSSTTIRVKTANEIKTILLEDYLKGLGEMPRSWSSVSNFQEAFKSQVVAARTYALFKMVRSSCRNFDVYSDTRDQAWTGNTSDGNWNSAVEATRGQVLRGGDNLIIAYYSANAGGYTLTPNQAWNGGGTYPSSVNDFGSDGKPNSDLAARCLSDSHYRWEYHYNFGRDGKIQYNDTCPGGDMNNNNVPLSNIEMEDLVDASIWTQKNGRVPDNSLNHDQIKAELGGESIGNLQSINANIANNQYTSNIHIVGSNKTIDIEGNIFKKVFNVRSPGKYFISGSRSNYSKYDILTSSEAHGTHGSGWYVYTYGYGHRIGLDQEGALGMAYQGRVYTEILSHYYQGTSLTPKEYSGILQ